MERLLRHLRSKADPVRAASKLRYHKGVYEFIGLTAPQAQQLWKSFDKPKDLMVFGSECLAHSIHEVKYVGVLALRDDVGKDLSEEKAEKVFDVVLKRLEDHSAADWATVDMLCAWVLHKVVDVGEFGTRVSKLGEIGVGDDTTDSMWEWKRRAACVAFVKQARYGKHIESAWHAVRMAVKDERRFAQLGAGWLLREIARNEDQKELVEDFVVTHVRCGALSKEGMRYAIEQMPKSDRDRIRAKIRRPESDSGRE